jgi:hypothetical protein
MIVKYNETSKTKAFESNFLFMALNCNFDLKLEVKVRFGSNFNEKRREKPESAQATLERYI